MYGSFHTIINETLQSTVEMFGQLYQALSPTASDILRNGYYKSHPEILLYKTSPENIMASFSSSLRIFNTQ